MSALKYILDHINPVKVIGSNQLEVNGLAINSKLVQPGYVFVALKGTNVDGHKFIANAIELGATVVVCENIPADTGNATFVQVKDCSLAAGLAADAFYNHPSSKMRVVGVTGTNGKTTTATLLYQLYQQAGFKTGLISTVQNHIDTQVLESTHTTPDAISVQSLLAKMAEAGCEYVFMEVSSHAVHQNRIAGIVFAGGIFTNITRDHLDYHKTFDEYIRVKKQFFDNLPSSAFALTNIDDKRGMVMLQNTNALKQRYSLREPAEFKGRIIENALNGLYMQVNGVETHFRMTGTFNAYNLLAVYGTAVLLGMDKTEALTILSNLTGASGRFETFMSPVDKVLGIVDYAHTPDALLNVLATVNQMKVHGQTVICIAGCGGDRDPGKRPLMAEAAATHSDKLIMTSDNPRSEDPEEILNQMEAGLSSALKRKTLRITDRREAIKVACSLAKPGDIIVIAGKGHETYQEIKGVKHHFDDREVLTQTFQTLNI